MKRLLPIGTILMLDVESKEKVMIIGRLVRKSEETKEVWDYCGCRAPYGLESNEELKFFNHEDVKRLLFIGYQDEEEIMYSLSATKQKEENLKKNEEL